MPAKIRPRYGIDSVQEVPAFSFADTEIDRLFEALLPARGTRADIVVRLVAIAQAYRWRRNQSQAKPTRAEQNAALTEVGQLACDLELKLRSLDKDTEWELVIWLPVYHTSNLTESIGNLAERLGNLGWAAAEALRDGKKQSGRHAPTHVQRAVTELASLYSEVTSNPFTHSPKVRTTYDGTPHSPAGRFILEFFSVVDPSISSTSLSTAMASIVRSRPRSSAGGTS
jgi:hypothetical protein